MEIKFSCPRVSYTISESWGHKDSKNVIFIILCVRKFKNFALNFEILDSENFHFCNKLAWTLDVDACKISWKFDSSWQSYHRKKSKNLGPIFWPCFWLQLSQQLTQLHQTSHVSVSNAYTTFLQKWKFSKSKISKFRAKF